MAWHRSVLLILFQIFLTFLFTNPLSNEYYRQSRKSLSVLEYRLPNDTEPLHYNVQLHPQISEFNDSFEGEIEVRFRVLKKTSNIVLHSANFTINELATSLRKGEDTLKPREHAYDGATETLTLRFENTLQPGIYTLNMQFKGKLSDNYCGFFRSYYKDGNSSVPFLATHFQKTSARYAFPCWDEPALKATFNISLKHFANYTALSNMPVRASEYVDIDGKYWTHFETTPIMSTNILAFVVSDFEHISSSDGTVKVWAEKGEIAHADHFLRIIQQATKILTKYLNSTVRVPKMDHVIIPDYSARAVENWGLIIYLHAAVPWNIVSDFEDHFMLNTMTVAHEISHQWFGNLVSPAWWKYFWMSEGMATYLKAVVTDQIFKNWRLMDNLVHDQLTSFSMDETQIATPISAGVLGRAGYHNFVYTKPSVIFWMLSHMLGEEVFRAGLIDYIKAHEYSSVTSDDLWEAMQGALNRSDSPHFPVKEAMDTWIEQTGYPLVTVERNYTTGDAIVRQQPTTLSADKTKKEWYIPINYATKSTPDFSSTRPNFFLKPGDEGIAINGINADDWIIVNLQQTGYYRVNYDETNWRRIADYLSNDDYKKIHTGNRIQLLDTAFRLLHSEQISWDVFLKLINYLHREEDYIVWNQVLPVLKRMQKYTQSPTGGETFKSYLLGLMSGFLNSIDYDGIPSDINDPATRTKIEALSLACTLGDKNCKTKAGERLQAYLGDPEKNKIPPIARYWVLCIGLTGANQSTWNQLFELRIHDRKEEIYDAFNYLTCTENADILVNYLNMSMMANSTMLQAEKLNDILLELNTNIIMNVDIAIDFIIRNIEAIRRSTNRPEDILETFIWKISRQDQLDTLKNFSRAIGINMDTVIQHQERVLQQTENEVGNILQRLKLERSS